MQSGYMYLLHFTCTSVTSLAGEGIPPSVLNIIRICGMSVNETTL